MNRNKFAIMLVCLALAGQCLCGSTLLAQTMLPTQPTTAAAAEEDLTGEKQADAIGATQQAATTGPAVKFSLDGVPMQRSESAMPGGSTPR